jgi:hypothetical protein
MCAIRANPQPRREALNTLTTTVFRRNCAKLRNVVSGFEPRRLRISFPHWMLGVGGWTLGVCVNRLEAIEEQLGSGQACI